MSILKYVNKKTLFIVGLISFGLISVYLLGRYSVSSEEHFDISEDSVEIQTNVEIEKVENTEEVLGTEIEEIIEEEIKESQPVEVVIIKEVDDVPYVAPTVQEEPVVEYEEEPSVYSCPEDLISEYAQQFCDKTAFSDDYYDLAHDTLLNANSYCSYLVSNIEMFTNCLSGRRDQSDSYYETAEEFLSKAQQYKQLLLGCYVSNQEILELENSCHR